MYQSESTTEQNIRAVGDIVDKFYRNTPNGGTIKIEVDRYGHIVCAATVLSPIGADRDYVLSAARRLDQ